MNLRQDCAFFRGEIIQQICFGLYQIRFNFSNNISIESGDRVVNMHLPLQRIEWRGDMGRESVSFNHLLEIEIISAKLDDDDILELEFVDSSKLFFFNSRDVIGESYIVHFKDDFEAFANWEI